MCEENSIGDIVGLLNDDVSELPIAPGNDLEQTLEIHFNSYFRTIEGLDDSEPSQRLKDKFDSMKQLATSLLEALGHWLDARPDRAMNAFSNGLAKVSNEISSLVSRNVDSIGPMYRVRVEKLGARYTRKEMFHIPFEKRDRVQTQRYSFPGLPCLYLGQSIYGCWEELGRPELSSLWISRFSIRNDKTVKVLDFGYRPALVAAGYQATVDGNDHGLSEDHTVAYAVLWPLIAGCSARRDRSKSTSFVIEYVLPQLLLWWITNQKDNDGNHCIDGIRYFSTHIEDHDTGIVGMNYVFPAQKRQKTGHCLRLLDKFQLTHPVNWQIAMAYPDQRTIDVRPIENRVIFEMVAENKVSYSETNFGKVELLLRNWIYEGIDEEQ